jgi:hypothetical protein
MGSRTGPDFRTAAGTATPVRIRTTADADHGAARVQHRRRAGRPAMNLHYLCGIAIIRAAVAAFPFGIPRLTA